MHELSIAIGIVDAACEELERLKPTHVTAVHLRLGRLSGIDKQALLFSFEVAAASTPLEGATLRIEDVAVTVWCGTCSAEHALASVASRRCPVCDAATPSIIRGQELEVVGLEIRES